jgi:hypothetical protein
MSERWWKTHPWRLIQTNLREIDMQDISAKEYVRQLKEFKATVVMLNTAGIISSYKTELPSHYQSPYLAGDSIENIIDACHSEGIKVIARTDFSKIRRPLYEQNPHWAYISPDGKIIDYNGDVHACINGEYQQKHALDIMLEAVTKLPVDGIFINMGGYRVNDYSYNYYGICHCDNCKRLFREWYGLDLPKAENLNDPTYRKYKVFQRETMKVYSGKIANALKAVRPDLAINGVDIFRQESNTEYGRPLPHWQYSASSNTRSAICTYPGIISSNSTVDFIGFFYRHVAVNPVQQELRLWQNLANCGGLDYYIIGRLDNHQDRSGYKHVKKVFSYHAANEQTYKNLSLHADILIVREKDWDVNISEARGWIRFLTERHFLFDEVVNTGFKNVELSKYKAIILADVRYLSDDDIKRIDEYAIEGGTVISAGEAGLYDSDYEPRNGMPLKCMGVTKINTIRDDMVSAMLLLDDKIHFQSLEDTDVLYFGDKYIFAEYEEGTNQRLKLIPPHDYGPPERCYYTQVTNLPGFTVKTYGKGKGIHIPWWPGKLFYREGYVNTLNFIVDLMENVAGTKPIDTDLPPMVEITLCKGKQQRFDILHLVNMSGHFGTTFYEPININSAYVRFAYPDAPSKVVSLVDGGEVPYEFSNGMLKIQVDDLGAFDAFMIRQ